MISVAMASYNGAQYILEQLESICNQTYKVDEIVIVDDCSNDDTVQTVREYMETHMDCDIKLFQNEVNLGYRRNFGKALSLCKGDVILLCDQDDIWMNNKVEVLVEILRKYPGALLVSSSFVQMDAAGNKTSGNKSVYRKKLDENELFLVPLEDLIFHNISQGCAMALRKEVKELYLRHFMEELPHDWMLNIIAAMKKKCYYINSPLFYYRIHDKNTIGLNEGLTIRRKNLLEVRTHDASQAIKVLEWIEKVDSAFFAEKSWLEDTRKFSIHHIEYLKNKKLLKILGQNFNPCYRKLKTFRGRILDLFFCVK